MVSNITSRAARIRLAGSDREDSHGHTICLGEGKPAAETDRNSGFWAEDFVRLPGLVPLTPATDHSGISYVLVCIFFFFFFNASSPKHFSCHVMFSLVLFSPALTLTDLLYLILGISLINILREKKINLPGVSVVLIEL